jgi:nicotinamide mononucleotide adenylyltransferase
MVEREELSGTEVRRRMYKDGDWVSLVSPSVATYIKDIDGLQRIKETYKYSTPYGTRENPEE